MIGCGKVTGTGRTEGIASGVGSGSVEAPRVPRGGTEGSPVGEFPADDVTTGRADHVGLRADGLDWTRPPGGGDALQTVSPLLTHLLHVLYPLHHRLHHRLKAQHIHQTRVLIRVIVIILCSSKNATKIPCREIVITGNQRGDSEGDNCDSDRLLFWAA